jgi:hypothetical protein
MDPITLAIKELESLKPGEKINITKVAKKYGLSRSTLSRRFRSKTGSIKAQYENQRFLTNQQSKILNDYIDMLTRRGLPPTKLMIKNFATEITGKKPGKNWVARWLQQQSGRLVIKNSSGLDSDRKKAEKKERYELYLKLIKEKIDFYNLQPSQIYNMDEKGFLIGLLQKGHRVFSKAAYEQGYKQFLQDGNREWITTVACICADGTALPPALIYAAKSGNLQDSWLQDFEAEKAENRCYFGASETGWTNNEFGLEWLRIFDQETKAKASRGWRLLIMDGHGSHVTMSFIEYCDKNRILLAILPPHSTHNLQPLDVALFAPLAKAYNNELDEFVRQSMGLSRITKRDFFRLFWPSWKRAFTPENVLSGFKNTGLSPFNPELILQRFTHQPASRPSSSGSDTSVLSASDWRKIEKLLHEAVGKMINSKAQKLSNTVTALATQNQLLKNENRGLKNALLHEKKHRSKGRTLLFNLPTENEGGAIFFSPGKIQQAREQQQKKNEQVELEKARKSDKKLQQQLAKEARELEKADRAQQRQIQREKREEEAVQKQLVRAEQELYKLADLPLQNDDLAAFKPPTIQKKQKSPKKKPARPRTSVVHAEVPVVATNRRGREIRLPERFRQ